MSEHRDFSPNEFRQHAGTEGLQEDAEGISKFDYRANVISATELMGKKFPIPKFAVHGVLSEGLTILAGAPKLGKSWLALGMSVAVATGGKALGNIPVEEGDVLYLGLEDGQRRLQSRLQSILQFGSVPKRLAFAAEWRPFDDGGLDGIEQWLKDNSGARMIVVDTLKRVRPADRNRSRLYDGDYEAVAPLADLSKRFNVCVVVVHHTRKMGSDDRLECVSGSTGLTGAADGIVMLERSRGENRAELYVTGRDFEEAEIALRFDTETYQWISEGNAPEHRLSQERKEIINLLLKSGCPMQPKDIADTLGKKRNNMRKMLLEMRLDGQVASDDKDRYTVTAQFMKFSNFGNGGNTSPAGPLFSNGTAGVTTVTAVTANQPVIQTVTEQDKTEINYDALPF